MSSPTGSLAVSATQFASKPEVAIPAASVPVSGVSPAVSHSPGCGLASGSTPTRNRVDPYMIIRSPRCRTPTLCASAHASTVPASTGVPGRRPVAADARGVTGPGQPRQGHTGAERRRPVAGPGLRADVVHRAELARGVVVDEVLAGEPFDQERARAEPARRASP